MDCIFCGIVSGAIPSTRIYEDEGAVAFMDINPGTRGHALVIPRRHFRDIHDVDPEVLAHVVKVAQRVAGAARTALAADGVNLVQSSGAAAFQSVFHIHFHVIPRYEDDDVRLPWRPRPADPADLRAQAERIRCAMEQGAPGVSRGGPAAAPARGA